MKAVCNKKDCVLALGAESVGIFAVYRNGNIFISKNFGDLLEEDNFSRFKKSVLLHLRKEKMTPNMILTDLHPLFKTTIFGEELAKKYRARHIKVQHHIAHIFSVVGDKMTDVDKLEKNYYCHSEHSEESRTNVRHLAVARDSSLRLRFVQNDKTKLSNTFFGIAMDGTGYGLDGNIWGGEVFQIKNVKIKVKNDGLKSKNNLNKKINVKRIGSLEEQGMIGGDLAVREPARMVIAILVKLKAQNSKIIKSKKDIYKFVKKFYTWNEFELLYNQLEQEFNCQTTTSTGRVLDAVSVLLGFAGNERRFKHEATKKLEENSTIPYDFEPRIKFTPTLFYKRRGKVYPNTFLQKERDIIFSPFEKGGLRGILQTTPLFEYLIKNIHKDKRRLAATAQLYIAKGLHEMIRLQTKNHRLKTVLAAGGLSNNKIIFEYLEKQGVHMSKKIPRGDEGIVVGQIMFCLTNKGH